MAIQMRRGNYADFDASKMLAGEFGICLDNGYVFITLAPGRVVKLGTADVIEEVLELVREYAESASTSATSAETSATNANASAEDSEAWAVGERGGEEVESTDPTYENNAKYYAEQAEYFSEHATYIYLRYSENSDGTDFVTVPTATTLYIGIYSGSSSTAPTDKADYNWTKFEGVDGFSPSASVSKSGKTATISITDKNGTTTAQISDGNDGTDGEDGEDGFSPSASVTKVGSVATIEITDKDGTTTAEVEDGMPIFYNASANPLADSVDGNIRSLKLQGNSYKSKNLLNPTLDTTTLNGITCTNNGDGTYTVNGTATANTSFWILGNLHIGDLPLHLDGTYKMIGFQNPSGDTTVQAYNADYQDGIFDYHGAKTVVGDFSVRLYVSNGTTVTNEIVKPMLVDATEYPDVTYADFEPYGIIEPSGDVKSFTRNLLNTYNRLSSWDSGLIIEDDGTTFRATINNTGTSSKWLQCTFSDISQFKPNHTYKVVTEILECTAGTYTFVSSYQLAPYGIFGSANTPSRVSVGTYIDTLTTKSDFTDCVTVARSYIGFVAGTNGTIKVRVRIYDIDDVSGLTDEEIKALPFVPYAESTVHTDRPLLSVGDIKNELIINPDGSGEFVERVGKIIADGTIQGINFNAQVNQISIPLERQTVSGVICNMFEFADTWNVVGTMYSENTTRIYFYPVNATITDMESATNWLNTNKPTFIYDLVTPTTTHLSASEVNELLSLKTYADATHIDTDGCPFEVSYFANEGVASVDVKVDKVKSDVDDIYDKGFAKGKNLLNPIFSTATSNGVTLTNNRDGTFTLNGTASSQVTFSIPLNFTIEPGKRYYYYGCPVGGTTGAGYRSCLRYGGWDVGNGNNKIYSESDLTNTIYFMIQMTGGVTANNVLFKPMVTEFPSSYADFEPYVKSNVELSTDVSNILNSSEITFTAISNEKYTVSELKALRKGKILMIFGRVEVISGDEYPLGKAYTNVATLSNVTVNWSAEDFLVSANGDYKPIQLASENSGSNSTIKLRGGTVGGIYIFRTIVFLV